MVFVVAVVVVGAVAVAVDAVAATTGVKICDIANAKRVIWMTMISMMKLMREEDWDFLLLLLLSTSMQERRFYLMKTCATVGDL